MDYIINTLQPYFKYLPYFFTALISSFLLTPIIGFLANKLGICDIPARFRKPTDETKRTRVRKQIVPRAGGLAVIIPFFLILLISTDFSKEIVAIIIGVLILTIVGLLDDKFELDTRIQLSAQLIATLVVVAAGISIDHIQNPLDTVLNLRMYVFPFTLGSTQYSIALPADILTIIWILMMINAINWLFGTDGLGEGISSIAFITILFISIKLGSPTTALIAAIIAGGILGFLPFNLSPSKIFSGTTGTGVYGFLIAVLSILGGVKVSTSVIVLLIPLIDMIWVMVGRINRSGITNILEVFKVTSIGDDTHLHHRLLKLGLSTKQIAMIECIAVGLCAVIAFVAADLPKITIIAIIGVIILISFLIVSILLRNGVKIKKVKKPKSSKGGKVPEDESPESRYAY